MTSGDERYLRIWNTVSQVPAGKVASYGQIAELAGLARGARMVGRALGLAPKKMRLPWHRIITASGKIAFPHDSQSYQRQRDLLLDEGVEVKSGRVRMQQFRWQPSLDELLWKLV